MAFRLPFRRQPAEPPPAEASVAPPPPPPRNRFRVALSAVWGAVWAAFDALDDALCWLAVPFGVHVADPWKRYAIMLGIYVVLFAVASLHINHVPLAALAVGYVGVLAIGRAWVRNEKQRTAIVKKLLDADPDRMPDLRGTALVSALQLLILFPLLYQQLQWHFGLYKVQGHPTFLDWMWFAIDKTYFKALPDWSILYGVHISLIDFDAPWGRHVVLLSRLTFDYILIQGVIRLLAIRVTINEAVAAIKADPDMAVRLGRRAIPPLVVKLEDPDRAVRGAAANALMQLGDPLGIARIGATAKKT